MNKKKIIALLISLAFLGMIFYKIDWLKLFETFKLFNFKNMWAIVLLYVSTLYLRGIRWKSLLLDDNKYSAYNLGAVFTVGSMLNIFLPARAGDVYRAYYLGAKKGEKKMKIFGSIILERTLDGISVFLILLWAILQYSSDPIMINLAYVIGTLFIGSFIVFYLLFKFNKIDFICQKFIQLFSKFPHWIANPLTKITQSLNVHINSFMEGFEVLDSFKFTMQAFLMSALIWYIECYVAYLIINSFPVNLGFSAALFVISLISFSTMLPSTSVFLGPYQYAYILALRIFGIDKSTTLAISTIHQGILLIILTIIGGFYLLKFNLSLKDASENSLEENDVENSAA